MDQIKAKKEEVLKVLRENKTKHIKEYKTALKGYRIKCVENLAEQLAKAEDGEDFKMSFNIQSPISHEKSYNTAIGMLELDVSEFVELDTVEYQNYVMDDWSWKEHVRMSNSGYGGQSGTSGIAGSSGKFGDRTVIFSDDENII